MCNDLGGRDYNFSSLIYIFCWIYNTNFFCTPKHKEVSNIPLYFWWNKMNMIYMHIQIVYFWLRKWKLKPVSLCPFVPHISRTPVYVTTASVIHTIQDISQLKSWIQEVIPEVTLIKKYYINIGMILSAFGSVSRES